MNAEQYRAVIGWFNARPAAKKALRLVSRSAVALVYLLYLGMLAWLAHRASSTRLKSIFCTFSPVLLRVCALANHKLTAYGAL